MACHNGGSGYSFATRARAKLATGLFGCVPKRNDAVFMPGHCQGTALCQPRALIQPTHLQRHRLGPIGYIRRGSR